MRVSSYNPSIPPTYSRSCLSLWYESTIHVLGHFLSDRDPHIGVDPGLEIDPRWIPRSGNMSPQTQTNMGTGSQSQTSNAKRKKLRSDEKLQQVQRQWVRLCGKPRSDDKELRSEPRSDNKLRSEPRSDRQSDKSIAGHPKNRLYLDSGASVHITFNQDLLNEHRPLKKALNISAAGKPLQLKEVSTLHKALQHLPLPKDDIYYEPQVIANLLSFARLADEYHIICNTQVDDAIYVQSKEDRKYLRFQQCRKNNLYYLDIGQTEYDGHCNFSTIEKTKSSFSLLDQKWAKAVQLLQEQCGSPSDEDFINALECNSVPGVDFGRRDINIANEIYGYSTAAAKGKMKHPRKGQKMNRTSEKVTASVPDSILKHYKDVHLDMDLMFVNGVAFFLATSRDIGFIHCQAVLSKHNKRVQDALCTIVADYQHRGFRVRIAFGDNAFEPLKGWMKSELKIDLDTCDADSHVLGRRMQ